MVRLEKALRMTSTLSEVARRVEWVLKKVWNGSQKRMAADIGVSQPVVSHIVTGRQEPGRKFLAALAGNPLINSRWLMTGEGDPLITQTTEPGRRAVYVARCLFEGLPEDHGDCLGDMLEVPIRCYRPSRYWFQVPVNCPLVSVISLKIAVGDNVLFEPDAKGWPENKVGHPCILRTAENALLLDYIAEQNGDQLWNGMSESKLPTKSNDGRNLRSIVLDRETVSHDAGASIPLAFESLIAVGVFRMGGFGKS